MNIGNIEKKLQALEPKSVPKDWLERGNKTIKKERMLLTYQYTKNFCKIAAVFMFICITFWKHFEYNKILSFLSANKHNQRYEKISHFHKMHNTKPLYRKYRRN
ncbi:hypothetical protein [Candidatus Uabimicrobium sp. HlEnr_7]|uniref:hypothetical protein n=1 Tax=Candidatus Uabimicrobium helgolandensis TaxID=3095367 RepID=UPI0035575943